MNNIGLSSADTRKLKSISLDGNIDDLMAFVENHQNINRRDIIYKAIDYSSRSGNVELIKEIILSKTLDQYQIGRYNDYIVLEIFSPLTILTEKQKIEVLSTIQHTRHNNLITFPEIKKEFQIAIQDGNTELVDFLYESIDKGSYNQLLFQYIIVPGKYPILINYLMGKPEFNPLYIGYNMRTYIMGACSYSWIMHNNKDEQVQLVDKLINVYGVPLIGETDYDGNTALHLSVNDRSLAPNYDLLDLLVRQNMNVNAKNNQNQTPLFILTKNFSLPYHPNPNIPPLDLVSIDNVAKLLLDNGADPYMENRNGESAYSITHPDATQPGIGPNLVGIRGAIDYHLNNVKKLKRAKASYNDDDDDDDDQMPRRKRTKY